MAEKQKSKFDIGQIVRSLKNRVERIERNLKSIRDELNTKDNWHAEIKDWIDHSVTITLRSGNTCLGKLLWTDRYNVCIDEGGRSRTIVTKGGIDTIKRNF